MLDRIIRAHQTENPVALVGIGSPHFLTVHQIMVALVFGFGLQTGQIRAGAGLRITLTPADFAADDFTDIFFLLLFAGKFQQRWAKHPKAKTCQCRPCFDAGKLFLQNFVFFLGQPATAIFGRPCRCRPAA